LRAPDHVDAQHVVPTLKIRDPRAGTVDDYWPVIQSLRTLSLDHLFPLSPTCLAGGALAARASACGRPLRRTHPP
jgi:hypothetical protein